MRPPIHSALSKRRSFWRSGCLGRQGSRSWIGEPGRALLFSIELCLEINAGRYCTALLPNGQVGIPRTALKLPRNSLKVWKVPRRWDMSSREWWKSLLKNTYCTLARKLDAESSYVRLCIGCTLCASGVLLYRIRSIWRSPNAVEEAALPTCSWIRSFFLKCSMISRWLQSQPEDYTE